MVDGLLGRRRDEAPLTEVTDDQPAADEPVGFRRTLRETRDSVGSVFSNRNLRRIELAFAGSTVGDWAYATAVAVFAYGVGGAKAVGIWMAVRYFLIAITSPFGALLADRMDRRRLMILADLGRAVLVAAAAICLFLDTPATPVFVLATLASLFGRTFMVAQRSMLPSLAERPEELTAANGVASTVESLAFFVGPAIGALMLGFTSVQVVFLFNVATFAWSLAMVAGVHPPRRTETAIAEPGSESNDKQGPGFLAETAAGFRTVGGDRGLLVVTVMTCSQTLVAGAARVFMVVMAVDILGTGARGVGFLDAVFGLGSILGGVYAISRVSRRRLGGDLIVGVVLWSSPLLLVAAWPHPVTCFAAMALLGFGNPMVDINHDTILQRLSPEVVLGRVIGAVETCFIFTMALGAVGMPFLIDGVGLRWALLALGVPVAVVALLGIPQMRALDSRLKQPAKLPLLRGVDIFAPLAPATLETLALSVTEHRFLAGEVLVREGDTAEQFFVIESGLVEVVQAGRVLRQEAAGEYFGEIGLLRDVPRTATVTAVEDTVVQSLARDDFLRAVTGHHEANFTAESIATRRLAV
jgi:MFS family permease